MNGLTKYFFRWIALTAVMVCFAQAERAVVLKSAETPQTEFQTYLKTEKAMAYSQFLLGEIQNQDTAPLVSLLGQAQEAFLKDHLKTAGEYFQSIVDKAHKKDWVHSARKIIFYSYLRLAQIEWKGGNAEAFLLMALIFADDMEPDASLFPPPLIKKFSTLRKNLPRLSLHFKKIFPRHEVILINGRVFSSNDKPSLPYGSYRVTALSSSHQKWNQVVSLSQLSQKKVRTAGLVSGSCKNPIVPQKFMEHSILFPDFCWWSRPINGAQAETTADRLDDLSSPPKKPFIQDKKKLMIGLGVLAGGVVLFSALNSSGKTAPDKKQSSKKATVKIGF